MMKILLGYGNSLVRDFIRDHMAKSEPDMTLLTAGTLRETLQLAAQAAELDVIGLDLELSDMDGLAGLDMMRPQVSAGVPIALIGPLRPSEEVQNMLQKGASGYLPYSLGTASMLAALRVLAAGETYVPVEMMSRHEPVRHKASNYLTGRERDVLNALLAGQSNKEIARVHGLSEVTIKHHLKSLRSKLGARNRTHAVCRAVELGIAEDDIAMA
ncbi:MAG: LuxR C-terminal-related transcriptional regulator [Candidatus Puniceispirillaceae bacterium]